MRMFRQLAPFTIFLLISVTVGIFIGNYFQFNYDKNLETSHHNFHEMLDLTQDQLDKLVPIEKAFAKKKSFYENQIRSNNMNLGDLMISEKEFTPEVRDAVEKIHVAMGGLQNATLDHFFDMRALLDEKQKKLFDDYVADVMYGL